ncbi:rRNA processing protein [Malassezia vespertilionis]|uniref:Pre-rRNA-processing protein n=1 Tax=Malassezia vespertilionis TaxID=2020962 RepID=A0A2N1J7I6_9BASI|nr:rRNA processing protein [Malassezia vespertilionis]PKI82527.1 hypothetical protein MVES_003361 [Malassezia vespertilionis]WFD08428.1 rRNA processing protein [Malassezia vespertilionis]
MAGKKRKAPTDFKKTRQKLGKGKQLASNATNTTFKAKSIALPQQSVTLDRSGSIRTRRNHTLQDLVQNTRHHAHGARKDAVHGLIELATTYPGFLEQEAPSMLHPVFPLVGDDNPAVRAAVAQYLKCALAMLTAAQFAPFLSTALLFITSALSHIRMAVRFDALRVLNLVLEHAGVQVTTGWQRALDSGVGEAHGQRILQAFFAMLGVAGDAARRKVQGAPSATPGSTSSIDLQPGDRLHVLRSLARFLHCATERAQCGAQIPLWPFQSALGSASELEDFAHLFDHARGIDVLQPFLERSLLGYAAFQAPMGMADAILQGARATQGQAPVSAHEQLAHLLHASLLATLLDALPAALAPEGVVHDVHLELVVEILSIFAVLWREIVTDYLAAQGTPAPLAILAQLHRFLSHLAPHFPIQPDSARKEGANTLLHLNAVYCELVALYMIAQAQAPQKKSAPVQHIDRTISYLAAQLAHDDSALSPEQYQSLIPTFWLLLTGPEYAEQRALMESLLRHAMKLPTTSPVKPLAFEFLARLATLHTYTSLRVPMDAVHGAQSVWHDWLLSLPRTLWEAATQAASKKSADTRLERMELAVLILQFLRRCLVQEDGVVFTTETLAALAKPLTPFFAMQHPSRGTIPGPVARLPEHARQIARAVALHAGMEDV